MNLNSEDQFFNHIKHSLRTQEFAYQPEHWNELAARLPKQAEPKFGAAWFYNLLGVCLAGLIIWALFLPYNQLENGLLANQTNQNALGGSRNNKSHVLKTSENENISHALSQKDEAQVLCAQNKNVSSQEASDKSLKPKSQEWLADRKQPQNSKTISELILAQDNKVEDKSGLINDSELLLSSASGMTKAGLSNEFAANDMATLAHLPIGVLRQRELELHKIEALRLPGLYQANDANLTANTRARFQLLAVLGGGFTHNNFVRHSLLPSPNWQPQANAGLLLQASLHRQSGIGMSLGLLYAFSQSQDRVVSKITGQERTSTMQFHWVKLPLCVVWQAHQKWQVRSGVAFQIPFIQQGHYWRNAANATGERKIMLEDQSLRGYVSLEAGAVYHINKVLSLEPHISYPLSDLRLDPSTYLRMSSGGLRLLVKLR
ncbi:MAG: hypothetical protein EAZ57_11660 [Cytophagales bacterium]|nr:MAG: hypothetical protein EAZ67_12565 [Cytophagales bacterium]TAF59304.1 MAG: hypothetical protein EAZ57_11660 [Cytophagales bacterium]